MNIKEVLELKEYDFLKEKELSKKIILLGFGGSIAYGTNIKNSDIDIRGIMVNSKDELFGLPSLKINKIEQIEDKNTDTVIYNLNKIIKLLMDCNPNTIEILYTKPEHRITNEIGDYLIENRNLFISQLASHSFNGFAISQINRLQNALNKDNKFKLLEELKYEADRLNDLITHFNNVYTDFKFGNMKFYLNEEENEILIDNDLKGYPMSDLSGIYSEISSINNSWKKNKKLKQREKDSIHLNKHAMHTIRLYMMGIDILSGAEISTYRGNDAEHKLLMDIRNGKYMKEDGTYYSDFFNLVKDYQKKFEEAKLKTKIPVICDYEKINKILMNINELSLK